MDHEFALAFDLLDEAAHRLHHQPYGTADILVHNFGSFPMQAAHHRAGPDGHTLHLIAYDDHGVMAAVQASAPDRHSSPQLRIVKVRAGHLTFHGTENWTFRAVGEHRYRLTAHIGQCTWALAVDDQDTDTYPSIDAAVEAVLGDHEPLWVS
jgi:hypothetical protein